MGQKFQIQGASPQTYYSCLLPDCQEALKAIWKATDVASKAAKYKEFIQRYGTGCVTSLYLEAGSIANINLKTDTEQKSKQNKYGVSVSGTCTLGSASAAAGWAKETKEAGFDGTFYVTVHNYPENAPTANWVTTMAEKLTLKGMDELADKASFIEPRNVKFEKAPPYPKRDAPSTDPMPKEDDSVDRETFTETLQKEILEEEGCTELSWEQFCDRQKNELKAIDKQSVVQKTRSRSLSAPATRMYSMPMESRERSGTFGTSNTLGASSWDLAGYIPVGVEVTAWPKIFPSLEMLNYISEDTKYYAMLTAFFYTRLQFLEYMQFIDDVGNVFNSDNYEYISDDIRVFGDVCTTFVQREFKNSQKFTKRSYEKAVRDFGGQLEESRFNNRQIYEAFFDVYEEITKAPYGYIWYGINMRGLVTDVITEKPRKYIEEIQTLLQMMPYRTHLGSRKESIISEKCHIPVACQIENGK